jgi:hypothetical protein
MNLNKDKIDVKDNSIFSIKETFKINTRTLIVQKKRKCTKRFNEREIKAKLTNNTSTK